MFNSKIPTKSPKTNKTNKKTYMFISTNRIQFHFTTDSDLRGAESLSWDRKITVTITPSHWLLNWSIVGRLEMSNMETFTTKPILYYVVQSFLYTTIANQQVGTCKISLTLITFWKSFLINFIQSAIRTVSQNRSKCLPSWSLHSNYITFTLKIGKNKKINNK